MKPWFSVVAIVGTLVAALCLSDDQLNPPIFVLRAAAQHAPPSGPPQMQPEIDNDAHIRDTKPDGTTSDYRRTAGTVEWVQAQRHAGENLSDIPIDFLAIIPRSASSVSSPTGHRERH